MKYIFAFLGLFSMAFASECPEIRVFQKDRSLFLNYKIMELKKNFEHITTLISSCKDEPPDCVFDILMNIQNELSELSYEIEECKYLIGELGYKIQD